MTVISKRRAASTFLIMMFIRPAVSCLPGRIPRLLKLHFLHACATGNYWQLATSNFQTTRGGNVYSPQTNFIVTRVTW